MYRVAICSDIRCAQCQEDQTYSFSEMQGARKKAEGNGEWRELCASKNTPNDLAQRDPKKQHDTKVQILVDGWNAVRTVQLLRYKRGVLPNFP